MNYYFNVKATEQHDEELAIIEAESLEQAKKEFAGSFPEDVENIEAITTEESIIDINKLN